MRCPGLLLTREAQTGQDEFGGGFGRSVLQSLQGGMNLRVESVWGGIALSRQ